MNYNDMQSTQEVKNQTLSKEYLVLRHAYLSFINRQQPVSIHRIPTPFVANHLFGISTVPESISSTASEILNKLRQKNEIAVSPVVEQQVIDNHDFEIGQKQQNNEVLKLGIKGMKSLANMGILFSSLISKKK